MQNTDKKRYHDLEVKKIELRKQIKKDTKVKKDIEKRIEENMKQIEIIESKQNGIVQYRLFKGE